MNTPREIVAAAIDDDVMMYHQADRNADVIIAALNAAGYVIVPAEPTEAMYAAAEREWDGRMSARSRGVWQAMLRAFQ